MPTQLVPELRSPTRLTWTNREFDQLAHLGGGGITLTGEGFCEDDAQPARRKRNSSRKKKVTTTSDAAAAAINNARALLLARPIGSNKTVRVLISSRSKQGKLQIRIKTLLVSPGQSPL